MSNPLRTPADYESFIYSLCEQFSVVCRSTVRFVRRGTTLARVVGELYFDKNVRLVVRERILYHRLPAVIDEYGYEIWQGDEKLYWYDPQPHPDDLALQSTHPHHKHIPPPLKASQSLTNAARYHSQDMRDDNYVEHDSYNRVGGELVFERYWYERVQSYYGSGGLGETI
jgi:hypothetical protein